MNMIDVQNNKDCCGCRVCEYKCPQKAIYMKENEEGFIYPTININLCTNCGLCSKICPVINPPKAHPPKELYSLQHKNSDTLFRSSSGGAFSLLAKYTLNNNGVVVGCILDDNFRAILAIADNDRELSKMQGSKYVFSDTNSIFIEIKRKLNNGQLVFFNGAPCQCSALINYLGKKYDNLVIADFLCHGMPSPYILDSYIASLSKKGKKTISDIKFRDKTEHGWGLAFSYRINGKYKINIGNTDAYLYGFTHGLFNRSSCYNCKFRGKLRITDFTYCDYWGVENYSKNYDNSLGVSALSFNSDMAIKIKSEVLKDAIFEIAKRENVAKQNPDILISRNEIIPPERSIVFSYIKKYGWNITSRKMFKEKDYLGKKIWYCIPYKFRKKIKKILR